MATPQQPQRSTAKLDRGKLEQAVQAAVRRALERQQTAQGLQGPIIVGIIAYPKGNEVLFSDLQSGGEIATREG